jgi:WG containing repeat
MSYFLPPGRLLFILLLLSVALQLSAQHVSAFDKDGKPRSSADMKAEESKNRQNNNYRPPAGSTKSTKDPSGSDVPETRAERNDYGKYDFRGTEDENGLRIVRLHGKWGYVNKADKELLPLDYEIVVYRGKGWYEVVCDTKKSGFANKNGMVVIPCQFDYVYNVFNSEGMARVTKYGKTIFINEKGEAVLPAHQNYFYHGTSGRYDEGLASVSLKDLDGNEKYGFLDSAGYVIIPLIYDDASGFHNGLATVKKDGRWGAIDKNGEIVIPLLYDKNPGYTGELFTVSEAQKWGVVDRTGKIIIPLIYDECGSSFSEGCIKMNLNGQWGFVDSISGLEIVPFKYNAAKSFSEGLAAVMKDDIKGYEKFGFVNKAGEEVIPFVYQEVMSNGFNEGIAGVMQNGYWGFIDRTQKTVVAFMYSDIRPFSEGLAAVKSKEKWGYIDKTGKLVIPLKYDNTYSIFIDGRISVKTGAKWGSINSKGEEIIAPLYDSPVNFRNGEALVNREGQMVFINEKGVVVATSRFVNFKAERVPVEK